MTGKKQNKHKIKLWLQLVWPNLAHNTSPFQHQATINSSACEAQPTLQRSQQRFAGFFPKKSNSEPTTSSCFFIFPDDSSHPIFDVPGTLTQKDSPGGPIRAPPLPPWSPPKGRPNICPCRWRWPSARCRRLVEISLTFWIGLLGKILTGNPWVFTIKLIGLSG